MESKETEEADCGGERVPLLGFTCRRGKQLHPAIHSGLSIALFKLRWSPKQRGGMELTSVVPTEVHNTETEAEAQRGGSRNSQPEEEDVAVMIGMMTSNLAPMVCPVASRSMNPTNSHVSRRAKLP